MTRCPDRTDLVDVFMPTIRAIANPVVRDAYLNVLHRLTGVEERDLLVALHRTTSSWDEDAYEVLRIFLLAPLARTP